jgi:hypothetical protein
MSITMGHAGVGEDDGRRNDTGKISNNGFLVFSSHTSSKPLPDTLQYSANKIINIPILYSL